MGREPCFLYSLCGFKNVLFRLHWPHSGSSLLSGDNRGLLESPQPPGPGVLLGKRQRSGPPSRVGSVLPFLRKDLVTVSPLSSNLIPNRGSKPLPRAQARVLKTKSLVKDAEKNLGSRATGTSRVHGPMHKWLCKNTEMVFLPFSLQGTVPPPLGRCSKFPAIATDYYWIGG